jgi:hypothetical protein
MTTADVTLRRKSFEMIEAFKSLLDAAPAGPRLEFGVCRGDTLALMIDHPGETLGIDSFEGMGEPGPHDASPPGEPSYPKGRLAVPLDFVTARFAGCNEPLPILVRGWIPDVLPTLPPRAWAFVHIDLDHYAPTLACLEWVWPRMLPGGIVCCDDWFQDRDYLAGRAINEWQASHGPFAGTFGRKAYWIL